MKILSAELIRAWDEYTIAHEPIRSIDLMERAAGAFVERYAEDFSSQNPVYIFCGPGNNGGDGLAAARMLLERGYDAHAYLTESEKYTPDNEANLQRLQEVAAGKIERIASAGSLPEIRKEAVVIDALFGTGLTRSVEGLAAEIIGHINTHSAKTVSIDIPSGLYCDRPNQEGDAIIRANKTYTFGCPKLSFFICENEKYTGEFEVLDIGLHADFLNSTKTHFHQITRDFAASLLKPSERCEHKGDYGHALIIAGSYGKMGAALLAGEACFRAGAGLVTMHIPECGYEIVQTALPEAMVSIDNNAKKITSFPEIEKFKAIGAGPGIGTRPATASALKKLLETAQIPLVLDADALNILSENEGQPFMLPAGTVLTPHPKEFERLAGHFPGEWKRVEGARNFAQVFKCILVLKGGYTSIHFPDGTTWFNTTGNPGMATGGSGDVLTGIITGLLAQGYSPQDAALLGVYLHGCAGDIAAGNKSQWSMLAGDIIQSLGKAFMLLENSRNS